MSRTLYVLGEALMDCIAQPDGSLRPCQGGSPFNLARAAALRGAQVVYLNPLSRDEFGRQLAAQLAQDGVQTLLPSSRLPTSLAVVQLVQGQPSYGFYREGIADRDYTAAQILQALLPLPPGIFHTGSLLLVPPEHSKVLEVLRGLKARGWTISVDINMRPRLANDLAAYVQAVREVMALADWLKASDEDLEVLGFASPRRASASAIALQLRACQLQAVLLAANAAAQAHAPSPGDPLRSGQAPVTHSLGNHKPSHAGTTHAVSHRMALTFGAQGAWLQVDAAVAEADITPVAVVDTVGAGDTFWGNCLADWALQADAADQRVEHTLQQAMRAAAINCSRQGCQPPTIAELSA